MQDPSHLGLRCLLRQAVMDPLQYEQDHLATLPKPMLNNASARYRLRQDKVMPQKGTHQQLMGGADTIEHDQIPGTPELIELLTNVNTIISVWTVSASVCKLLATGE